MTERRLTIYRVRRFDHDGTIADSRMYARRASADARAARWLAIASTASVTVEATPGPVEFQPVDAYAPLPQEDPRA